MDYFNKKLMEFILDNKDWCIFICCEMTQELLKKFDMTNHIILEAKHPSPLSANKGGFFGCKHFSKVNEILKKRVTMK